MSITIIAKTIPKAVAAVDKIKKLKRDKIKRRIQSGAGFSFVELLVTILILTLASGGMARGVAFARDQYRKSMVLSEAKTLCSTLSDIIKDELRNATDAYYDTDSKNTKFTRYGYIPDNQKYFYSYFYALDNNNIKSNSGELWIGDLDHYTLENPEYPKYNKRLVSKAAYSAYQLQAGLKVEYESGVFHVTLKILDAERQSEEIVKSEFDVFPLNS